MTSKILIIDDDPIIRLLAVEKLAEEGFTVIEAEDSATGIQLVLDEKPDLVIVSPSSPDAMMKFPAEARELGIHYSSAGS